MFKWNFSGGVDVPTASSDFTFHVSPASAAHLRRMMADAGAFLTGRRTCTARGPSSSAWKRGCEHVANTPLVLGDPTVVAGVGVTHLCYPVRSS